MNKNVLHHDDPFKILTNPKVKKGHEHFTHYHIRQPKNKLKHFYNYNITVA